MADSLSAIGIDLGGTKIEVAMVHENGEIVHRLYRPTVTAGGPAAIEAEIIDAVGELRAEVGAKPVAVGVGVAGQVSAGDGVVSFAPNLDWHDVPLQADLRSALGLPVVVTNDVRAAALGEWLFGAGQGHDDIVCLFVGTGIGGGIVSGGRLLSGCSNIAGELGHITVDMHGRVCHCGNRGCLEALAGGWAIAERAQEAILEDTMAGAPLLNEAGGLKEKVTAEVVGRLFREGDPLSCRIMEETADALGAGVAGLVNAYNPCCLILGGGVIEGVPEIVSEVEQRLRLRALPAASRQLQVVRARLHNDAGVIGAAVFAIRSLAADS